MCKPSGRFREIQKINFHGSLNKPNKFISKDKQTFFIAYKYTSLNVIIEKAKAKVKANWQLFKKI